MRVAPCSGEHFGYLYCLALHVIPLLEASSWLRHQGPFAHWPVSRTSLGARPSIWRRLTARYWLNIMLDTTLGAGRLFLLRLTSGFWVLFGHRWLLAIISGYGGNEKGPSLIPLPSCELSPSSSRFVLRVNSNQP